MSYHCQWLGLFPLLWVANFPVPAKAVSETQAYTSLPPLIFNLEKNISTQPLLTVKESPLASNYQKQTSTPDILLQAEGELGEGHETLEDGSRYDEHIFQGESGQIIKITFESESFDTYLRLESPSDTLIAENDDGNSGTNSEIVVQLTADGPYRIISKAYDATGQGPYRLTVANSNAEELRQVERQAEAMGLFLQGNEQYGNSQYRDSLASWLAALELFREVGHSVGVAASLGNLGNAYNSLGDFQQAVDFYEQQLVLEQSQGDRVGEANALGNAGSAYNRLGNYPKAIESLGNSLVIYRAIDDLEGESFTLGNLGLLYSDLGNHENAISYHEQNLIIARELENIRGQATALINLGLAYNNLESYEESLSHLEQALVIARSGNAQQEEITVLVNLGNTHSNLGNEEQAITAYEQVLPLARELGDRLRETASLSGLGNVYDRLGNYEKALGYHRQSLELAQATGFLQGESIALSSIGFVFLNSGDFAESEKYLSEAVIKLEELRATELSDTNKITLLETQLEAYKGLEQTLILQNKPEAALEIAERGRSRAFVELLSGRQSRQQSDQLSSEPPDFVTIQRIAKTQQSVLVEYSLIEAGPDSPSLYIWVIQPTGEITFRTVSLDENTTDISALVSQSRNAIGARGRGASILVTSNARTETAQLRELHQLLIEPIADLLPEDPDQRVTFMPQGPLFLVPFAALIDETGRYLIEKHTLLTAPSIQVLDLTQQQRASFNFEQSIESSDILVVGNPIMPEVWNPETSNIQQLPNLPGAAREAEAIAEFFNTDALLQEQATELAVKQRIANARIVHLATHGLLEYGSPQDSGIRDIPGAIALTPSESEDGLLTSAEILENLILQAELVVLSACDTGLGNITGDGVIGLSRSLIASGTPSVIVSLWSVPDSPTATLMTEFYRHLQQGQDKAQSLRQAMLTTMQTHPNPTDWAAFTLIGDAE